MTKNKVFILFRERLAIITLFFLFIPFTSFGKSVALYGDDDRYVFTENFSAEKYVSNVVYLPYCGDIGESVIGAAWVTYPSDNLPQAFNGLYPTCLKLRYCSDTYVENGERKLYVTTPGYDDNGQKVINCYKKSCLDLTPDELETIYLHTYGLDNIGQASDVNLASITDNSYLYNYCNPYKYENKLLPIGNDKLSNIGIITDEYVYCHEFAKQELEYLIPNIRGLKDRNGDNLFQCMIHQCPPSSNDSLKCYTNFWLFSFVNNDDNDRVIRSNNYKQKYIDNILLSSNITSSSSTINTICTSIYCSDYRYSTQVECTNNILNTSCDNYVGLDKTFQNTNIGINANITNIIKNYMINGQQCVNEFCQKTVDCGLQENFTDNACSSSSQGTDGTVDTFYSYFYRPFPPQKVTEILPIKKEDMEDKENLTDIIYGDNYEVETLTSSNIDDYLSVTAIKRLMRGAKVRPLPGYPGSSINVNRNGSISMNFNKTNEYLKNYFNYLENGASTNYTNNICFSTIDDFKKYGYRTVRNSDKNNWEEGDYYYSKTNNGENFSPSITVFSVPICESADNIWTSRLNTSNGINALCHIDNNSSNSTPKSDSYYIKGKPKFEWYGNMAKIKSVSVTACLRKAATYNNTTICGARECIIECSDNNCSNFKQTCGMDSCVDLKWTDGELDCTMDNVANNMSEAGADSSKKLGCYQIVTESDNKKVRFRLNKINDKMYVFVDAANISGGDTRFAKSVDHKVTRTSNGDVFNDQNFSIVEYKGKLTGDNLFDNNNLDTVVDSEYITDTDVFGEEIYNKYSCGQKNNSTRNNNCTEMAIGSEYTSKGNWIVWDIIQYIGNNQPQYYMIGKEKFYNPNCKVGQIKNCRGYYDADGNFFRESQGIPLPLAASPNKFYKYTTSTNSSNLFFPLLKIYSIKTYDNISKIMTDTKEDDDLELSFFEPTMLLMFEHTQDNIKISFDEEEKMGQMQDSQKKYTVDYIVRKITETDGGIQPEVCLIRKLGVDINNNPVESVIKCVKRRKPDLNSIMVKIGYNTSTFKPYLKAYFVDDSKIDREKKISLNDKNSIEFKNVSKNAPSDDDEKANLPADSVAKAQTYPINIKSSYCYELHYDCIDYRKQLIQNQHTLQKLNKEGVSTTSDDYISLLFNISQLTAKVSRCENIVQEYCNNLTSGIYSVKTLLGCYEKLNYDVLNKCNNIWQEYTNNFINIRLCLINNNCSDELKNIINEFNKYLQASNFSYQAETDIPVNYNVIGAENDLCISSGFETYFPNVVAMPSVNNTLGKCVLNKESKQKSQCRRTHYYTYCTDNNDVNCKCLNGTADCDCTYGNTCVKKNSCECSNTAGTSNSCTDLPEECYLPGWNSYNITIGEDNKANSSCTCEFNTTGIVDTNREIRQATAKELGLCVSARNANFCQPIKYYDSNKNYSDGGAGETLSVIKEKYKSNIWRTDETKEGIFKNNSLEHAEFDLSNYYIQNRLNIESLYCYNENTGHYYLLDNESNNCRQNYKKITATEGQCKGFWKNKTVLAQNNTYETINPLANCGLDGSFTLMKNTGCERYSCPTVNETDNNYVSADENSVTNITEKNSTNTNRKGLSHGYANWAAYKKGSDSLDGYGTVLTDGIENGHGDDIEQRTAESCIYGYVPAGFSKIINKYYPVKIDNSASDGVLYFDKFVKNMLLENQDYISASDMIINLNYNAKDHLPVRYCNQVGQWMPVDDIYTKYKINLYNLNSAPFHDLDNDGYVKIDTYKNMLYPNIETNTYGISVDYSKKYCERSFCKEISTNDVPLYLDDEHNIEVNLAGNETDPTSPFSRFLGLDDDYNVGYFANEDTINAYTVWRHTGGATWQETPGPLSDNDIRNVIGSCDASKHFYPHNAIFLQDSFTNMDNQKISYSSFEKQYNNLFSATNISISSIIKPELKKFFENTTLIQHPTRRCNKYGVWGAIENECEKACEPLDPFRTNFTYEGSGNNLKVTVLGLYKTPRLRNDYYKEIDANTKVGDIYTGGARWGRTLAGQYAIGECDSTIKTNMQIYNANGQLVNSNQSITFISNGSKNDVIPGTTIKIGGRPYRECLPDGTWGPVHNPCMLYKTCPETTIYNTDLPEYKSYAVKKEVVGTLSGSSMVYEDAMSNNNSVKVTTDCDSKYYEPLGTISQNCLLNTQQWETNSLTNSCILKTCPPYSEKIGEVEIVNINSTKGLYYPKGAGFSGQITYNNRTYKGYTFNNYCPNYFECVNCEDTKTVKYTCVYDEEIQDLTWQSSGECEPRSCLFTDLITLCNQSGNCVPRQKLLSQSDVTVQLTKEQFSSVIFSNNNKYNENKSKFAIGSHVILLPKNNYRANSETYAYCNESGTWEIIGGFQPLKCSTNSLEQVTGATWISNNTVCSSATNSDECDGGSKKLVCTGNASSTGTRIATCRISNNTARWEYSGSLDCHLNCPTGTQVKIILNTLSCNCPDTVSGICGKDNNYCVALQNISYTTTNDVAHGQCILLSNKLLKGVAKIEMKIPVCCNDGQLNVQYNQLYSSEYFSCTCTNGCSSSLLNSTCN